METNNFTQNNGLKRNTLDKYFTKPIVSNNCIQILKTKIEITKNDFIIEPSAGNGSFIQSIKELTTNHLFYDILPENNEIIKQDFLELTISQIKLLTNNNKIHIIGNPPFGRQSSLAIKFIKKCCEFANTISFILPKSFKKDSMKKCFNNLFHLVHENDIENNAFLVNGIEYDVPCVFQIWIKREFVRENAEKVKEHGYEFVKKNNNPHISFRRVGVNAGVISKDIENKSEQSHYFIKFNNGMSIDENIKLLENIHFDFNNTVGPKSISKSELITIFNTQL